MTLAGIEIDDPDPDYIRKWDYSEYEEWLYCNTLRSLPYIEENLRPYFYESDFYKWKCKVIGHVT